MPRYKVTFLVESLAISSGGTALEVATLANELAKNPDFSISVLSFKEELSLYNIDENVKLILLEQSQNFIGWIGIWCKMRELLKDQNTVFVTGIWGPFDGLGLRLVWPSRAKVFIRICGMLEPYILRRNRGRKFLGKLLWVNRNLARAKGLITNSIPEATRIKALNLTTKIPLRIPNGVTTPSIQGLDSKSELRIKLGLPVSGLLFLYLGRIHPKKGLHLLLEALTFLEKTDVTIAPYAHLVVAGKFASTTYQHSIEQLLSAGNISWPVHFVGEVSGALKDSLFRASDVFILPSESEGLPNAVLEAMSYGLPVVLTDGCNIPEIGQYNAGKVVPFETEGLVSGLKWALQGEVVLETAGRKATDLIYEKFNLIKSVQHYSELIQND